MRAYGIPQAAWFTECLTDDMATAIGMDPYEFRMKNCMEDGFVDPANGITFHSYGLKKCMEAGKKYIHWDEKREAYKNQTGPVRRGVGMAIFCYKTGVHPISLETSSVRMVLNQMDLCRFPWALPRSVRAQILYSARWLLKLREFLLIRHLLYLHRIQT